VSVAEGVDVSFRAKDGLGRTWLVDVAGGFTASRPGLRRTDTLWKALGKAAVLHAADPATPLLVLTTDLPVARSSGAAALAALRGPGKPIRDVLVLSSADDFDRLRRHATGVG
jgi:site-specific DNA-methyltransferase (adenine-specific)